MPVRQLVLASTSTYRRMLLERLRLPFTCVAPEVDETPLPQEEPQSMALRLASAKARAGAEKFPAALIVGSDQVAVAAGTILGKPGSREAATQQLRLTRGASALFHTALCLLDAPSGSARTAVVTTRVRYRDYSDAQIARYLERDEPWQCAGSARLEALGITLIERLEGEDPTALIGLPLIALTTMLNAEGIEVP
ncbi:MAG TPA: Maf family nucleotide pyrophosphatase [Burkholderiales bacterium]|jgi:septum formation protein|nr:Maf family nucleotide pyrophosphatase [Burkholderiales bacterium]